MLLDDRIGAHARAWRQLVLARRPDHAARRLVEQPVIAAAQIVALDLAVRQRRAAVAAAILERDRRAVRLAIEHDRLVRNMRPSGCSLSSWPKAAQYHWFRKASIAPSPYRQAAPWYRRTPPRATGFATGFGPRGMDARLRYLASPVRGGRSHEPREQQALATTSWKTREIFAMNEGKFLRVTKGCAMPKPTGTGCGAGRRT